MHKCLIFVQSTGKEEGKSSRGLGYMAWSSIGKRRLVGVIAAMENYCSSIIGSYTIQQYGLEKLGPINCLWWLSCNVEYRDTYIIIPPFVEENIKKTGLIPISCRFDNGNSIIELETYYCKKKKKTLFVTLPSRWVFVAKGFSF